MGGRIFTKAKMKRRIAEVEASIERYLDQLDEADDAAPAEDARPIKDKIAALEAEMDRLKKLEVRMLDATDEQLSLTDPDARSMKSRGNGIVGYNVHAAVDVTTHLIVAHDVTNAGIDRRNSVQWRPGNGGASVRHVKTMDGIDVPDQDNSKMSVLDESSCAGVQHEASHQPRRNQETHRSDLTSSLA